MRGLDRRDAVSCPLRGDVSVQGPVDVGSDEEDRLGLDPVTQAPDGATGRITGYRKGPVYQRRAPGMHDYAVGAKPSENAPGKGWHRHLAARTMVICGVVLYILNMHYSYVNLLCPEFDYWGYAYNPPSSSLVVSAWLIAILPSFWIPIALRRPSLCIYWLLYVMVFVPASIIPWYWGQADPNTLLVFSFVLLAVFSLIGIIYRMPLVRIAHPRTSVIAFWSLIVLLSIAFYTVTFASFGLQFRLINLEDVYDVRREFNQSSQEAGRLAAYAVDWQSHVINALLIGYGLAFRKWPVLAAGLLGQLAIYAITAERSVLFSSFLSLSLLLALWRGGRFFGLLVLWGMAGLMLISAIIYSWFESITLISLLTRRMIIVPGLMTGQYVDFFSKNPHTMLGDGILSAFVDYPYSLPIANMIGAQYYRSPYTGANANLFAYGYASFGITGVILFAFLLALTMWTFDSLSWRTDLRIAVLMLALPSLTLANSSLFTCLLQHGMALTGILLYLYPGNPGQVSEDLRRIEMVKVSNYHRKG